MKNYQKIVAILTIFIISSKSSAQFFTVTKSAPIVKTEEVYNSHIVDTLLVREDKIELDSVQFVQLRDELDSLKKAYKTQNEGMRKFAEILVSDTLFMSVTSDRRGIKAVLPDTIGLPKLTLINLYDEIIRNGIAHPKIVLMQAILETGWFQSSVCRTKQNLFGLTNPRTADYYEFRHWTESVRAYYTKVQYRYKGGDYLTRLKKIGYAEDPGYISKLKVLLAQFD